MTLPSAQIETYWRWNFRRKDRQDEVGESAFVPTIFFFVRDQSVRTWVAWAEGIPILLPIVDRVLVPRQRLAPRRWFRSRDDIVVFEWAELAPIIERFPVAPGEPACYELFYEETPSDIERLIRAKQPPQQVETGITFDKILDQESVEQARATGSH